MRHRSEATTASDFPAQRAGESLRSRLVQPAPGPETPDTRDKAGAQRGMIIILAGGGLFWLAVAAGVALLVR